MNNFGKLERVIESKQPNFKKYAFSCFFMALLCFYILDIGRYSDSFILTFVFRLLVLFFVFTATYFSYKKKYYIKDFDVIKLYTHGLSIDEYCFEYKTVNLEIQKNFTATILVFKNNDDTKAITITYRKNSIPIIIDKIKNYN